MANANLSQFVQFDPVSGAASYDLKGQTGAGSQLALLTGLSEPKAGVSALFPSETVGFGGQVLARSIDSSGGAGPWTSPFPVTIVGLDPPTNPQIVDA